MAALPEPDSYGLPTGSVIAVPAGGLTVYRLVLSDPPTDEDFATQPAERAERMGWAELVRLGVSHYLERGQADARRRLPGSRVARVTLNPHRRIHVARTGRSEGHVTVWAPPGVLKETAAVVDDDG